MSELQQAFQADSPAERIVERGEALVRIVDTTQMQVAIQRPRDEAKILKAAVASIALYPEQAEASIYAKPVGRDDKGVMQWARELSIRAAEDLMNRWSNSAWSGDVIEETQEGARIAAVAVWSLALPALAPAQDESPLPEGNAYVRSVIGECVASRRSRTSV